MAKITSIKYVCDCCGVESDQDNFSTDNESGSGYLKIKGTYGAKDAFGNWGGRSIDIDKELCFRCIKSIEDYYNSMKKRRETQCQKQD